MLCFETRICRPRSHDSEKRLIKKCRELNQEIVSNATKVRDLLRDGLVAWWDGVVTDMEVSNLWVSNLELAGIDS